MYIIIVFYHDKIHFMLITTFDCTDLMIAGKSTVMPIHKHECSYPLSIH